MSNLGPICLLHHLLFYILYLDVQFTWIDFCVEEVWVKLYLFIYFPSVDINWPNSVYWKLQLFSTVLQWLLLFSHSVMSDSLATHGLQGSTLLCSWDFPGLLEWCPFPSLGDLLDPGIKSASPALQADSLLPSHQGSLFCCDTIVINPVHMYGSVSGFSILFCFFACACVKATLS